MGFWVGGSLRSDLLGFGLVVGGFFSWCRRLFSADMVFNQSVVFGSSYGFFWVVGDWIFSLGYVVLMVFIWFCGVVRYSFRVGCVGRCPWDL